MLTKAFECRTSFKNSPMILIPVPWSATTSYGGGTEKGPQLIRQESHQLDFFNSLFKLSYNEKIHFLKEDSLIQSMNTKALSWVYKIRKKSKKKNEKLYKKVNSACRFLLDWTYEQASTVFSQKKIPALVGGDHSISEALLSLIGERTKGNYGILHLDAHADLRPEYENFKYSHASVMFNVLNLPFPPKKLIQVAVRDFCKQEYDLIKKEERIQCYFDDWIYNQIFKGKTWAKLSHDIISKLPEKVYVSLDVDALTWDYAPDTGTPVPGGLSFNQVLYLFAELKSQKKKIIAFDVVETSGANKTSQSSKWNGNVSARLIYYLCGLSLNSYGYI
ncbi:MAG: arginase family protein [Bdellovibrionales bacterium]|nr:arginase family protein [Bdellovibrionales bacterium]